MFSPKNPFLSQRLPLCNIQLLVSPENKFQCYFRTQQAHKNFFLWQKAAHKDVRYILSAMGYIAEGLKDTPATGKTTTSYCCLVIHLIKQGKESKSCYRQIPNESQKETPNTQKKREDGSENFKANPGIFTHSFNKV